MSYRLEPNRLYRAPTHFGPAPGPRQNPDGGRWANVDRPYVLTAWLTVRIDAGKLDRHLPPGFAPPEYPCLYVEVRELRELDWLAGRGYNILHISFGARHVATGRQGRLSACVFESRADPIITGRDELGIPKMFAEVSPLHSDGDCISASASWDGFCFFELKLHSLRDGAPSDLGPGGAQYMHHRYVPRVGSIGQVDANYVVLGETDTVRDHVLVNRLGAGFATFHRGQFADLPTLFHIVNGLADLDGLEVVGAGLVETRGRSDHRNLRVLSEAEAAVRPA